MGLEAPSASGSRRACDRSFRRCTRLPRSAHTGHVAHCTCSRRSRLIALAAEGLSGARADLVVDAGWWRNPLLMGITLIVVGLPVWARYWRDTQLALTSGLEERAAPSRRVYVFGTVGVAIFALLVSLTTVLYQVFHAVLAADVSAKLLLDAR